VIPNNAQYLQLTVDQEAVSRARPEEDSAAAQAAGVGVEQDMETCKHTVRIRGPRWKLERL
jgi:hypothetical protein